MSSAIKKYRKAEDDAMAGRCATAFSKLLDASKTDGAFYAHAGQTDKPTGSTLSAERDASRAFSSNCGGRGILSGIGAASATRAEGIAKNGKRVKLVVQKDKEYGEWQVRVYEDGKFKSGPTYHGGTDRQDAVDTFKAMKAHYGLAGMRRRRR